MSLNLSGSALARSRSTCLFLSLAAFALWGCGSNDNHAADAGAAGGAVSGASDTHCDAPDGGLVIQPTRAAACHPDLDAGNDDDSGGDDDYGATLYNAHGYDDDCKYSLGWTSTPIRENTDVTFTVNVGLLGTDQPATGGNVNNHTYVEAFLNDTHPGDTASAVSTEGPDGTYTIGPVRFDAPGRWTVRFHVFGDCVDETADSPHGHAAFYVDVP